MVETDEPSYDEEEAQGLLKTDVSYSRSKHSADDGEVELGERDSGASTASSAHGARPERIGAAEGNASLDGPHQLRVPSAQEKAVMDREKAARMRPLYKVWPSQNSFFCSGLLVTGGSEECCAPNICVWACILVPSFLYFGWVLPGLVKRGCYALPGATLAVFLITVGSLLLTCCTDPGILPRREVILSVPGTAELLQESLGYDVLGTAPGGGEPQLPDHLSRRGYRWCRTCHIIRPPRASHCPDCDNCVLRYDHHCPFVNNCVGQRNYHFFFGFVTCVMVLAIMVLPAVFSFFAAIDLEASLKFMIKLSSAMWIVFYGLIAGGALVALAAGLSLLLWLYHVFLILTNKTTKEYRKDIDNVDQEPTLCASRGPRLFDPQALIDPRDLQMPRPKMSTGQSRRDERYR